MEDNQNDEFAKAFEQVAVSSTENNETNTGADDASAQVATTEGTPAPVLETKIDTPAEISDEVLLAAHNKRFGTEFKSLDELKPKAPEPTEAEKQMALSVGQRRALDKFIEIQQKNATSQNKFISVDDATKMYYAKKGIANGDVAAMSRMKVKHELIESGLTEEEATKEMKTTYHQYTDEDLEGVNDEEKSRLIKLRDIYTKRLDNAASIDKFEAQRDLDEIQRRISEDELENQVERKINLELSDFEKGYNRTMTIGRGDFKGLKLSPVEYTVPDKDFLDIMSTLKDKDKREALLYNEDGSEKIEWLAKMLILEKSFNQIVEKAVNDTSTEQVNALEKFAARNPKDLEQRPTGKSNSAAANKVLQVGTQIYNN